MTQEVQPLTWSKRTNIEEHQQFFSKINEIIGNLAPTVDEAEQAIAQATAAIASANDAVATANTASAAASAAASQAQTAASTVAGYDGRLTAAEGDIDSLQAADQTITGNVAALGTRMTAAESKNTQQDTSITALQNADAQNVKINQVGVYAVDLTSDQDVGGIKKMVGSRFRIYPASASAIPYIEMKGQFTAGTPSTYQWFIQCRDKDDVEVGDLILSTDSSGNSQLSVALRKADGTTVTRIIATSA